MKTRILIALITLGIFSSCIVKSIQPFYTADQLKYNEALVGKWIDQKNGSWDIRSFKIKWKEENEGVKLDDADLEIYEKYKEGYYMTFERSKKSASFVAMPFMVNEHLFIDVTPFEYESDDLNSLAAQHLLKTHSTAYVHMHPDKSMSFKWVSESAINHLFEEQKLRLKHENSGIDDDLILTASSEELHQFLKKFMAAEMENKWDSDDVYTLKPANATP